MHVAVAHVKTYLRRVYFVSTSVSIIGVQNKGVHIMIYRHNIYYSNAPINLSV